ncbi:hypothetical protein SUDANB58_03402 [Streptomyces sp. enrichment culture]
MPARWPDHPITRDPHDGAARAAALGGSLVLLIGCRLLRGHSRGRACLASRGWACLARLGPPALPEEPAVDGDREGTTRPPPGPGGRTRRSAPSCRRTARRVFGSAGAGPGRPVGRQSVTGS